MSNITGLLDNGYDDIVTFGRVLAETICAGSTDPTEILLAYFEAPHKWESEYQKWRELGGTLDKDCLRAFEDWYDHRGEQRCPKCDGLKLEYVSGDFGTGVFAPDGTQESRFEEGLQCVKCGLIFEEAA